MRPVPPSTDVPFSRSLDVASISDAGLRQTIEADETERRQLAAQDGIVGIETMSATFKIRRDGRWGLFVSGEVKARIRQTCVVTLEDFDTDIVEPIELRFLPVAEIEAEAARRAKAPNGDEEQEDLPDPIVNGRIDLGAIAAEFLTLALDPYPKKPGTVFVEPHSSSSPVAEVSPFAALSRLKTS